MIDPEAQSILMSELESDERLLWAAKPNSTRVFRRNLPLLLFACLFTSIAVYSLFKQLRKPNVELFSILYGIPFLLVGFWLLSLPFIWRNRAAFGAYGLTEKRAIINDGRTRRSVQSYGKQALNHIERRDLDDGNSDVILTRELRKSHGDEKWYEIGFWGVADGREAERILRGIADA